MSDIINIGIIGLGCRGMTLLQNELLKMPDINVAGVSDNFTDRAEKGAELVRKAGGNPLCSTDYRDILEIEGIDAVFIATSWEDHVSIALECMEKGIFTAIEVGGAYSIEDCWALVDAYERTKTPCMLLENCCYGEIELLLLNMTRKGLLGEIVHCSGGYMHDLREEIACGKENRHYRLRNYIERNCENYPTHELGPICKIIGVNRGNRMLSLSSFSSKAAGLHQYMLDKKSEDEELVNTVFSQGDIVTTVITCERGETIVLTLDTTLPRPYSRGFTIKGTKGMYQEDGDYFFMDDNRVHRLFHFSQHKLWGNSGKYRRKYRHPLWRNTRTLNKKGHGGMDTLVIRAMCESIKKGIAPPIDVYDTAAWMAITALSEKSIAEGGRPVEIPDFTRGKYIDRQDINKGVYSLD